MFKGSNTEILDFLKVDERERKKAGMKVIESTIVQKFHSGAVRSRASEEQPYYSSPPTVNGDKGSHLGVTSLSWLSKKKIA